MQVNISSSFSNKYMAMKVRAIDKKDTTPIELVQNYYKSWKNISSYPETFQGHINKIEKYIISKRESEYCAIGGAYYYYRHEIEKLGYFRDFKKGVYISLLDSLDVMIASKYDLDVTEVRRAIPNYLKVSRAILYGKIKTEDKINLDIFINISENIKEHIYDIAKELRKKPDFNLKSLAVEVYRIFIEELIETGHKILHRCCDEMIKKGIRLGIRTTDCYSILCTLQTHNNQPSSINIKTNNRMLGDLKILTFERDTFTNLYIEGIDI